MLVDNHKEESLRVHCFQHVEFEDLGCIEEWCRENGHRVTYTKFFENGQIPTSENYDWLIVMGGPMNIHDEKKYPWLLNEKAAIKNAIQQDKVVIGICLGAQLIADVLGAKVYRGAEKEIGWFDISLTEQALNEPILENLEKKLNVFHWHGDTFELPGNAKHLAFSEASKNQAILYKEKVLGLQFHFEVTENSIRAMIENGREELTSGRFIQREKDILTQQENIKINNHRMFQILDKLALKKIAELQ